MQLAGLVRLTYWGGWAAAGIAVLYKLFIKLQWVGVEQALAWQVFPRHFWQLSFLLFLMCVATAAVREKSA